MAFRVFVSAPCAWSWHNSIYTLLLYYSQEEKKDFLCLTSSELDRKRTTSELGVKPGRWESSDLKTSSPVFRLEGHEQQEGKEQGTPQRASCSSLTVLTCSRSSVG